MAEEHDRAMDDFRAMLIPGPDLTSIYAGAFPKPMDPSRIDVVYPLSARLRLCSQGTQTLVRQV